ncbi:diguanylate cyclase [Janthinobacterium sp. BJB412]|nr:diguanylate cyclase [Janthinobacterium sp. BJB412]
MRRTAPAARPRPLILIVEDELAARLLMRATLEEGGFDVVEADCVAQALVQFQLARPDLLLLDVMLPDGDGVALCARLRGLPGGDVPIAMVTGLNDAEAILLAYQSGATDFIAKPISWGTMAYRIRYMLRARQALLDLSHSERETRLAAKVFDACNEAIMITDGANRIVSVNPVFARTTGFAAEQLLGRDPRILADGAAARRHFGAMWAALRQSGSGQGELACRRRDGAAYPAWFSLSLLRDADGRPEHHIAIFSDISARKEQERRIAHLAYHDELTGLANRALLADHAGLAITKARRERGMLSLLFVDIDRFKNINDSLGHSAGDELLRQVAGRLCGVVRACDTVSRMGGDEFVMLCPGAADHGQLALRADAILRELARPFDIFGMALHVSASMGVARFPADGETFELLIRNADAAMYRAKESGRNTVQFYTPDLSANVLERLQLEMDLRRALAQQEFVLYFQPKLDAVSGALTGAEALIRWRSPQHGLIPPNRFIPVAEEAGLIEPIGQWVLSEACRQMLRWQALGVAGLSLAVNVSARQFKQADFVASTEALVRAGGVAPALIELELTESMLMSDAGQTAEKLHELKALGFSIAIDDFGTGFSSLHYLRHFPVDVLKIDQSFVREMFDDAAALAIIDAVIALANALGMGSVAEGVETEAQRATLRERGCRTVQGYLIARPMPSDEFVEWARAYRAGLAADAPADADVDRPAGWSARPD